MTKDSATNRQDEEIADEGLSETDVLVRETVNGAEEIYNPLDGLVERVKEDPGAAFKPEVLEELAALRKSDRATFEALRSSLKKSGCRVTELDKAIAQKNGEGGGAAKQADILIALAEEADPFHSPDGAAFVDVQVDGHRETWPVRSGGFRRWLLRQYFEETGGGPNSEALQSALNTIEARAHFDAPEWRVFLRVGEHEGKLYLDLADQAWRAVEVDESGWRVVDEPPVRFRRPNGMLPLPAPVKGGSIEALREFLNVGSADDFVLIVGWILGVLRGAGPYHLFALSGEQGSAKSTFSAMLRALVDPNTAPLRALPREDRELFIAATNAHVLMFDNLSGLPAWISDTFCRLATGGGFAVRRLHTDQDEVLFTAARPVLVNGIEDIVTRPDLADRAIFVTLEPITGKSRRSEKELWAAFEKARPQILGALLDAVSFGLGRLHATKLEILPRMADCAVWVTACEGALWDDGTFMRACTRNRDEAVDSVIEADPVATSVQSMMTSRTDWTGTATELLGALSEKAIDPTDQVGKLPPNARALSGRLRRVAPFLRRIGIDVSFERKGSALRRPIHISRMPENGGRRPSIPSEPSADRGKGARNNGAGQAQPRTQTLPADANGASADHATVRENAPNSAGTDGTDGADANIPAEPDDWPAMPDVLKRPASVGDRKVRRTFPAGDGVAKSVTRDADSFC